MIKIIIMFMAVVCLPSYCFSAVLPDYEGSGITLVEATWTDSVTPIADGSNTFLAGGVEGQYALPENSGSWTENTLWNHRSNASVWDFPGLTKGVGGYAHVGHGYASAATDLVKITVEHAVTNGVYDVYAIYFAGPTTGGVATGLTGGNLLEYNYDTVGTINLSQPGEYALYAVKVGTQTGTLVSIDFDQYESDVRVTAVGLGYKEAVAAWNESPVDGEEDVLTSATLSWNTGLSGGVTNPDITKHYVYMVEQAAGEDPNWLNATMITEETDVDPTGVTPPVTLQQDQWYYWHVDESVNDSAASGDANTIVGDVWLFETQLSFPVIEADPVDTAVFPTETASFTVEFSSLSAITANQWFKSTDLGVTWTEVTAGITLDEVSTPKTSTLTFVSAGVTDEALYYCTLTNSGAAVDSGAAGLAIKRLVAHYEFEGDLTDSAGTNDGDPNNTDPLLTPDITYDAGVVGTNAVVINATTDPADPNQSYISLSRDAYPKAGPGGGMEAGTILCWVKTEEAGTIMGFFNDGYNTAFRFEAGSLLQVLVRGEDDAYNAPNVSYTVNDGQWHFLAARWELGGENRAYAGPFAANGIGGTVGTSPVTAEYVASQYPMIIGAANSRGSLVGVLSNAAIDDIKIYNYALTDSEIADAYNAVSSQSLCVAAYESTYDFDGNCKVDLSDFAAFAIDWLECGLLPDCN